MKRSVVTKSGLSLLLILIIYSFSLSIFAAPSEKQMYYELRIYRLKDRGKEAVTDKYLKEAFIPAMRKAGITAVGVFKPVESDTAYGKLVYVFIPYKNMDQYIKVVDILDNDPVHKQAGSEFLDAPYNDPPFTRYESVFMKAFSFMPNYRIPPFTNPKRERIYELRSYESWTEAKASKKIHMFNEGGEIAIFEKIGANAVFYGQVLIGSLKPRLIYMTTYSNMQSRDEHWKAFGSHPDWKALSAKPEYANTVIKPNVYLLYPAEYSDF